MKRKESKGWCIESVYAKEAQPTTVYNHRTIKGKTIFSLNLL